MAKRFLLWAVLLGCLGWPLLGLALDSPSFGEVIGNLNLNKNTSLAVDTYWRGIQGSAIKWSGVVTNVVGGRGRAEIQVANPDGQTYKGYNIIINTFDLEAAARLKKGDTINFTGLLRDYKGKKGHPIVIVVNEGQIQ